MAKYFVMLTNVGAAKLAKSAALGEKLEITQMAVGDGGGSLPTPDPAQTKLVNELRRGPINTLSVDPINTNQIIAEQVLPEDVGGWWIREFGLFDKDDDMVAVANCAETYKPKLSEGSGRVQVIRAILIVSSTQSVALKIDPSVVLATRQYVDEKLIEVKGLLNEHIKSENPHPQYLITKNAFSELKASNLVDKALKNLGLDDGSVLPVGVPVPWPSATPPTGWLKCNGAVFDKEQYPLLARAYPTGKLPDLRGNFIRGWDDDAGIDNGRSLLSVQNATSLSGNVGGFSGSAVVGIDNGEPAEWHSSYTRYKQQSEQAGDGVRYQYVRPRNVALNYIVRAA